MTYLTSLIGRFGKTLGIGSVSTTAPATPDTTPAPGAVPPASTASPMEGPAVSPAAAE